MSKRGWEKYEKEIQLFILPVSLDGTCAVAERDNYRVYFGWHYKARRQGPTKGLNDRISEDSESSMNQVQTRPDKLTRHQPEVSKSPPSLRGRKIGHSYGVKVAAAPDLISAFIELLGSGSKPTYSDQPSDSIHQFPQTSVVLITKWNVFCILGCKVKTVEDKASTLFKSQKSWRAENTTVAVERYIGNMAGLSCDSADASYAC
ncbi:hypothetical protein Tco_0232352 [Tanacetum coccineum]